MSTLKIKGIDQIAGLKVGIVFWQTYYLLMVGVYTLVEKVRVKSVGKVNVECWGLF